MNVPCTTSVNIRSIGTQLHLVTTTAFLQRQRHPWRVAAQVSGSIMYSFYFQQRGAFRKPPLTFFLSSEENTIHINRVKNIRCVIPQAKGSSLSDNLNNTVKEITRKIYIILRGHFLRFTLRLEHFQG